MIYLDLFLKFLTIGCFSFGGGYGMISLVRETVVKNGWLTGKEFMDFIAISESTPGPLAVNMATFVGSSQGGIIGALCATLGVILPSFIIILLISAILKNFMNNHSVAAFLSGVRPCVVAMIIATAVSMALSTLFGFTDIKSAIAPDYRAVIAFALLIAVHFAHKKFKKASPSPIAMIVISAVLGIVLWT